MSEAIVVGTDGSPSASQAVIWAAKEAAWHSAELRVVLVLPEWTRSSPPGSRHPEVSLWQRTEAHRAVDEAAALARRHAPDIAVYSEVLYGDPTSVLADQPNGGRPLLVVGGHGLGAVRGLLLGSVAFKLAGRTAGPLIVTAGESTAGAWREIVVGVDGSPGSEAALSFAFEEAARHNAGVRALYAWEFPLMIVPVPALPRQTEVDEYAQSGVRRLSQALKPWRDRYPDVAVEEQTECGHPVGTLQEASAHADLLVVGSRGHGGFRGLVLGSVSHGILHHAQCPVAILPSATPTSRTAAGESGGLSGL